MSEIHKIFLRTTTIICFLAFWQTAFGHGYIFSKANEEMKDNIHIEINQNFLIVRFESTYMGQIAPHTRLMIDQNGDEKLEKSEVNTFFNVLKQSMNQQAESRTIYLGGTSVPLQFITAFGPTLTRDSLLAPLYLEMIFSGSDFFLPTGENELIIDPNVLFATGNHLIRLAKEKVEFTVEQEKAIGRFLQVNVTGNDHIRLLSTYPGRIRKKEQSAQIFGVFYEKAPLESEKTDYPEIRIKFEVF